MAAKMQHSDSLRESSKIYVRQYAVNHFSGQEDKLQEAMETLSKYKSGYSSLNNFRDVKKRPNEMRDKSFAEHLLPGIALQVLKRGDNLMIDFNAYLGYRITGRITSGIGWNQRIAYDLDNRSFSPQLRVYGPRVFSEYKLGKGFYARAEFEYMNTQLPDNMQMRSVDPDKRVWVHTAFVGISRDYRIARCVRGNAMIMTRLYNYDKMSPYPEIINLRFGFEFPIRKESKE